MSTVTIELTLEQLVNAFLKLSPEDQVRLLKLLLESNGQKQQLSSEATRIVYEIRLEREKNLRAAAEAIRSDYAQDKELTAFTAIDSDDFHG